MVKFAALLVEGTKTPKLIINKGDELNLSNALNEKKLKIK